MTALLQATGLRKSFGLTTALQHADFSIDAGEIVAIMGPSGSGKSTLLHCLAGIMLPDAGTVSYDGTEVTTMADGPRSALRLNKFGFVFQFGQLIPELTCAENIALPLQLGGARRKDALKVAQHWLDKLEVPDVALKLPSETSGGQSQRVAMGRALAPAPAVIFADEPTGALDSLSGEKVMTMLISAARETNAAVVIVTHEARIAAWSDREVLVRDGSTNRDQIAA